MFKACLDYGQTEFKPSLVSLVIVHLKNSRKGGGRGEGSVGKGLLYKPRT